MKLTIHCPDSEIHDYLDVVKRQLDEGYTSGYVDRETHWELDEEWRAGPACKNCGRTYAEDDSCADDVYGRHQFAE